MTATVLDETVSWLRGLARAPVEPEEALRSLAALRQRSGAEIELVWEREPYGDRVHYDALVCEAGEVVSISVCPDDGVPWPLRGVQRWSDSDLLRVDGRVLTVQSAVHLLDLVWDDDRILTRLVDMAILLRERDRLQIPAPDADALQQAVDDFRLERGLLTPEATEAWLAEHGLDLERLERVLSDRLIRDAVRDAVVGGPIAGELESFDVAVVTVMDFADAELAEAAAAGRPLDVARRASAAGRRVAIRPVERLRRTELPQSVAAAILAAQPGAVFGPWSEGKASRVVEVLAIHPADPEDPETAHAVQEARFADWQREQRRRARVEWMWGTAGMGGSGTDAP